MDAKFRVRADCKELENPEILISAGGEEPIPGGY